MSEINKRKRLKSQRLNLENPRLMSVDTGTATEYKYSIPNYSERPCRYM